MMMILTVEQYVQAARTHSLTLIFSAMMSGSSQMDSTKKTWRGRTAAKAEAAGGIVKGEVNYNFSG